MPYLAHFGLKDHPFTLTPNVDYYYPTQETANIVASLDFALRRDTGIIKIVGDVGTGKTLLCRLLINKLVGSDVVAYINAPQADAKTIIRTVCDEFGVVADPAVETLHAALNRFLVEVHAQGKLAVVVVDEAQHLGLEGLEAVRLISNLETEKHKLLQVVLFGQSELDDLLRETALRQLTQRIAFAFQTKPLTIAEAKRYIVHRIRVSRQEGVVYDIFSEAALTLLARCSGGIPRVANIVADKSLLVAFSEGSPTVQRQHALEALRDSPDLLVAKPRWGGVGAGFFASQWRVAAVIALVGLPLVGGLAYLAHHWRNAAPSVSASAVAVSPDALPAAAVAPAPTPSSMAPPSVSAAAPAPGPVAAASEPLAAASDPPAADRAAAPAPSPSPTLSPTMSSTPGAVSPEAPSSSAAAVPVAASPGGDKAP